MLYFLITKYFYIYFNKPDRIHPRHIYGISNEESP